MESYIKVRTTPNIIGKEFESEDGLNIRFFEALNFKDPEPDLDNETWKNKYGDNEYIYKAIIRHQETKKYLNENYVYASLSSVKRTLNRMIKQMEV